MGELAIEYSEILKRIAALRQELRRLGSRAVDIGQWLQGSPEVGGEVVLDHRISKDEILAKLTALREAIAERAQLESRLQDLGLGNIIRKDRI